MKKEKLINVLFVLATASTLITGCKKESLETQITKQSTGGHSSTGQSAIVNDQNTFDNEYNESLDDVNSALNESGDSRSLTICDATIDTAGLKTSGIITITYNGTACVPNRKRTGVVTIQLPFSGGTLTRWSTKGAVIGVTYTNFKVENTKTNEFIILNGAFHVTNVDGGSLIALSILSTKPVVHKVRGYAELTFTDGTKRTWGVAKTRTFTSPSIIPSINVTITGDTVIGSKTKIAQWGTNRAGDAFSLSIPTDIEASSFCAFRPSSGVTVYTDPAGDIKTTLGVDKNGNPISMGCAYGYKVNWTDSTGTPQQVILPY